MKPEDLFHIGLVVEDFDAAQAELSELFGYRWSAEMGRPAPVVLPAGETVLNLRCAFSTTQPRVELVRRIPGTLWEPTPDSGIHHLGYWSDDMAADCAALEERGYIVEATAVGPSGVPHFAFYRGAAGPRVELLTRAVQPSLEGVWSQPAQPVDVAVQGTGA